MFGAVQREQHEARAGSIPLTDSARHEARSFSRPDEQVRRQSAIHEGQTCGQALGTHRLMMQAGKCDECFEQRIALLQAGRRFLHGVSIASA